MTEQGIRFKVNGELRSAYDAGIGLLKLSREFNDPETKKLIQETAKDYFDLDLREMQKKQENQAEEEALSRKLRVGYFWVGILSFSIAIGLGFWAFAITDLSADQRNIVRFFLPIAAGFVAGSFTGYIKVDSSKLGIGAVAASGGFAVFFLLYFLWPNPDASRFTYSIYLEPNAEVEKSELDGTVTLELDEGPKSAVVSDGFAKLTDIDMKYNGKELNYSIEVNGYVVDGASSLKLEANSQSKIRVKHKE